MLQLTLSARKKCFCLHSDSTAFLLQLLSLPGELIVKIAEFLDPRSVVQLASAHKCLAQFLNNKHIWCHLYMTSNSQFDNKTFLFVRNVAHKVESVHYAHTGHSASYVVSFANAVLNHMPNLCSVCVQSPFFEFCHFMLRTECESLHFLDCPRFDVESFIEVVTHRRQHSLRVLDLRGVPSVSNLNLWTISFHCHNLRELYTQCVMNDWFTSQVFLHCKHLQKFDCVPNRFCLADWWQLCAMHTGIAFGPQLSSYL